MDGRGSNMIDKTKDGAPEAVSSNRRLERRMEEKTERKSPQKRIRRQNVAEGEKRTVWVQIRMFPIWLRILIVVILVAAAAAAGLMVGYGVIGNGEPKDALKWDTWTHILNIIQGKES